jgi:hypothetical protein
MTSPFSKTKQRNGAQCAKDQQHNGVTNIMAEIFNFEVLPAHGYSSFLKNKIDR